MGPNFKVNNAINPRDPLYRGELVESIVGGDWPRFTEFAGMMCFDMGGNTSQHIGNFQPNPLALGPIQGVQNMNAGTMGAWINLASIGQHGSGARIMGWMNGGSGNWTLGVSSGEAIDLRWRGAFSPGSVSMQDNDWHFICQTKGAADTGSNIGHYMDGELDHTSNGTSPLNNLTAAQLFRIGSSNEAARAFRGFVGPCYLWYNRELSASDIQAIYRDPTLPYQHMLRRRIFVDSAPAPAGRIIGSRTIYSDGELQSALH